MIVKNLNSPYLWYDFRVGGKRYRGSTRQVTAAKARTFESRLMAQVEAGASLRARTTLLRDYAPRFLREIDAGRLAAKTKAYYRNGWRLLAPQPVAGMRLEHISTGVAERIQTTGGGSNINCALRTLRRMLSLAAESNLLPRVPRIHLAKELQRERMIGPAEETLILARADAKLAAVVTLIMDTGMRPSEVAALAWEQVDFAAGIILVLTGKTRNSRRHLPMTSRVRDVLTARAAAQSLAAAASTPPAEPCLYVFPRRFGDGPTSGRALAGAFYDLKQRLNLPKELVLYSARHTFATDLLASTGNVGQLKKAMGHSSLATTQRYLHPETADLGRILDTRNQQRQDTLYTGRPQ